MHCPPGSLKALDAVQRRALKLIGAKTAGDAAEMRIQPLQHRRLVAGLTLFKKIIDGSAPQRLAKLLQETRGRAVRRSERLARGHRRVLTPWADGRSLKMFDRSFLPVVVDAWNELPENIIVHGDLQDFKEAVNE